MLSLFPKTYFRVSITQSRTLVTARFPYGESSFRTIQSEGSFLIDKTIYIRTLEASGKFNKIWRPRRFGKTVVCDMLSEYYDAANSKDKVIYLRLNTVFIFYS